jgi:hypothetical protein
MADKTVKVGFEFPQPTLVSHRSGRRRPSPSDEVSPRVASIEQVTMYGVIVHVAAALISAIPF